MSKFVFEPHPAASVAVNGEERRFPVRRIFCVGRNYAEHAREMGHDPDREPPFFFTKPADALVENGKTIPYPPETKHLQHEIELVVAIGHAGFLVPRDSALELVYGYAVGIDLTRRDLQSTAKKMGRPWDWGKAFDRSAPCAPIHRVSEVGHPHRGQIWLKVNGQTRQNADISELIWTVPDIIAHCSRSMELKPGDLIYTGTPAGVGPVHKGDKLVGGIDHLGMIEVSVGR